MKQFVTRYFLLFVVLLAIVIAFAMKATVFQTHSPVSEQLSTQQKATAWGAEEGAYWASNRFEINTYQLEQAYKGKLRAGEAQLIFKVETISPENQKPTQNDENSILVMKSQLIRRFAADTLAVSLVTSALTPIHNPLFPNTLAVSTSNQGWEGHRYWQLHYRDNAYQVREQSSDESAVKEPYTLAKTRLEDELWNRIRLENNKLPAGDVTIVPGTASTQLRNIPLKTLPAKATLADYEGVLYPGKFLKSYTLEYPTDGRTLVLIFESKFPHKIVGWEETYRTQDNLLTSRAVLKNTIQTDNREHKSQSDSTLRN
ncbi:hypothetical protein GCM10028807_59470 [Spirosoma daeguense]